MNAITPRKGGRYVRDAQTGDEDPSRRAVGPPQDEGGQRGLAGPRAKGGGTPVKTKE
ncbi:hypothetical protein GCM10011316_28930 [Roseibium aquae]|uniref:Uncharacterized protein n=1 Tax=Roseibium aquae TaxID=1323746 RepID=A0A916X1B3_9HYPH|nr:hypothetical protein [Roseibium aquae]GGB55058.1 hypothetical protein GCM10011316_28930 [Roseibium aquae]